MDDIESPKNNEAPNDLKCSEIITIHKCKLCKIDKTIDNYYKLDFKIGNTLLKDKYFTAICRDCIPEDYLYLDHDLELKINQRKLYFLLRDKQRRLFTEKYGLFIDDLFSKHEACNLLKCHRSWIHDKVKNGILSEYIFITYPESCGLKCPKPQIEYFYKKDEILAFKKIREEGFLSLRTKPSIKKGKSLIHNPPYFFTKKAGKEYLFTNTNQENKPCSTCLEIKPFEDFSLDKNMVSKFSNECRECLNREGRFIRTGDPNEARAWHRGDREKALAYKRQIYKKLKSDPKHRVRKALKMRFRRLVSKATDRHWRDWISSQTNPIYFTSSKLLGINLIDFIKYIESKWLPGMTWENYGLIGYEKDSKNKLKRINGELIKIKGWQIDHIKCVDSFDFTNDEDLKKVNYYTNLLPMWWWDNYDKSNKQELSKGMDADLLSKYKDLEILIKEAKL